jgi:hypothetical protein
MIMDEFETNFQEVFNQKWLDNEIDKEMKKIFIKIKEKASDENKSLLAKQLELFPRLNTAANTSAEATHQIMKNFINRMNAVIKTKDPVNYDFSSLIRSTQFQIYSLPEPLKTKSTMADKMSYLWNSLTLTGTRRRFALRRCQQKQKTYNKLTRYEKRTPVPDYCNKLLDENKTLKTTGGRKRRTRRRMR